MKSDDRTPDAHDGNEAAIVAADDTGMIAAHIAVNDADADVDTDVDVEKEQTSRDR